MEHLETIVKPLRQSNTAAGPSALFGELLQEISGYHPSKDTAMIEKAYQIAADAHKMQVRKSGEPYIIHPLCAAIILSKLKMDKETIAAALLHDVVEDTDLTTGDIASIFGSDVAHLVDGVTKLNNLPYNLDLEEMQAENLRKLFLAMAKDIRVILIKLADRLHNLRTLQYQPPHKQVKIARETLEIYAPLAMKLGISKIRTELDDLSLQYLEPAIYTRLKEELHQIEPVQKKITGEIIRKMESGLAANHIKAQTYVRPKHLFSIYKQTVNHPDFVRNIYNTFAICIIVDSVKDCYSTLGVLHETFTPVYGQFKDYIALPKQNMYQSLHTTLISDTGHMFEVQIKTYDMLMAAEYGITVYWKYHEMGTGSPAASHEKMLWLQQILEWQQDLIDNKVFLGTLKEDFDLLSEKINCFTPKGDVKLLPKGATPIDFAYGIHTTIGNTMVGANINHAPGSILSTLENGDIVEIITSKEAKGPQTEWLKHIKTPQAKNKINDWLKKHAAQTSIPKPAPVSRPNSGNRNSSIHFAKCCNPMPGDEIKGVLTKQGTSVHRQGCCNLEHAAQTTPDQITVLNWSDPGLWRAVYTVSLNISVNNRIGMMEDITKFLAERQIEIGSIQVTNHSSEQVDLNLILHLDHKQVLSKLMEDFEAVPGLLTVERA